MVGVPRSKGCRICVQRRVKCDQTRPTCNNCAKGGRPCPGYATQVQFRDEGPRLKQRHQDSPTTSDRRDVDADELWPVSSLDSNVALPGSGSVPGSESSDELPHHDYWSAASWHPPDKHRQARHGLEYWSPLKGRGIDNLETHFSWDQEALRRLQPVGLTLHAHISSPSAFQQQLFNGFAHAVAPASPDYIPSVMKTQWAWLQRLPDLMGSDALLDSAIRAVSLVQLGRQEQSLLLVNESRPFYGQALRLLNSILTRGNKAGMSNKTLCATALLSFYEMFASDSTRAWVRHAGGVAALMCQRGPKKHRYGFDREILRAYRFTLVTESFQTGRPCFLAQPEWMQIFSEIQNDIHKEQKLSGTRLALFDLTETCFKLTAETTQIASEVRIWVQGETERGTFDMAAASSRFDRMKRVRSELEQCQKSFTQTLSDMDNLPTVYVIKDSLYPEQYDYNNIFTSLFYAGYRTTSTILDRLMLLLGRELIKIGKVTPKALKFYAEDCRWLSRETCKSVDFMMRSSFLGPFFAVFALRLASQVFVPGEREWDWVIGKLFAIAERYFMMAKHLPWYEAEYGDMDELKLAAHRGGFRLPDPQPEK